MAAELRDWKNALLLFVAAAALLIPAISGQIALVVGITLSLAFGISLPSAYKAWTSNILGAAVTLLGAGVPLSVVVESGGRGLGISLVLIASVLVIGSQIARWLKVDANVGTLITSGTAICGGSAIAAVSGSIRSTAEQTAVSLAIVFVLNSIAVFVFPPLGHFFGLTGEQFGVWAAMAIHDTSSVLGAAVSFGHGAEDIAVPMKLARALWIIPTAAVLSSIHSGSHKGKPPWFVFTFIAVAAAFTLIPQIHAMAEHVEYAGKRLLVLVLFIIGSTITREILRTTGWRPLALGIILWVIVSVASLAAILGMVDG